MYTTGPGQVRSQWWNFAVQAAEEGFNTPEGYTFQLNDFSAAAAEIRGTPGLANYNPIGVSQLFARARTIANSSLTLTNADDSARLDDSMKALAPWAGDPAARGGIPVWQIKAEVTYTDAEGVSYTETLTAMESQVLPSTVGGLRNLAKIKFQSLLDAGANTRYPEEAQLVSIGRMTILEV